MLPGYTKVTSTLCLDRQLQDMGFPFSFRCWKISRVGRSLRVLALGSLSAFARKTRLRSLSSSKLCMLGTVELEPSWATRTASRKRRFISLMSVSMGRYLLANFSRSKYNLASSRLLAPTGPHHFFLFFYTFHT